MANTQLSKNADFIQTILKKYALNSQVIEFSKSTHTAKDAASAIGCELGQIIKSLIFRVTDTNEPILVLVSGTNRVDEKILEATLHKKITKADATFSKEVSGFSIGGIPPIGHLQTIKTVIDKDLLNFEMLWAAAGTPNAVFNISSKQLCELTQGTIVTIK